LIIDLLKQIGYALHFYQINYRGSSQAQYIYSASTPISITAARPSSTFPVAAAPFDDVVEDEAADDDDAAAEVACAEEVCDDATTFADEVIVDIARLDDLKDADEEVIVEDTDEEVEVEVVRKMEELLNSLTMPFRTSQIPLPSSRHSVAECATPSGTDWRQMYSEDNSDVVSA
jgi:hypothetical protein